MPAPDEPLDTDDRPRRRPDRDPDDRDPDEPRGGYRHYDEDGYEITSNDQMWAIFAHLGVFLLGIFAPLIILLVYGEKSPFVRRHARESLNHQISLMLYMFGFLFVAALIGFAVGGASQSAAAGLITGYVLAMLGSVAIGVGNLVLIVFATVAASRYQYHRYPFSLRLLG